MARAKEPETKEEADAEADEEVKEGRLRWIVGWVGVPGTVITSIFVAGVHVGANYPDMWLSRLIAWIAS